MSAAYHLAAWGNVFVATAGGAAALSGLIFVAVSMHLSHVVEDSHLRVAALAAFTGVLRSFAVSCEALLPGQGLAALGAEAIATHLIWLAFYAWWIRPSARSGTPIPYAIRSKLPFAAAALAVNLAAGIGLLIRSLGGLYLLAAGVVLTMFLSVANAWFLLTAVGMAEEESEEHLEREISEIAGAFETDRPGERPLPETGV